MGKTLEQMDEAFGDMSGAEEKEVMRTIIGDPVYFDKNEAASA